MDGSRYLRRIALLMDDGYLVVGMGLCMSIMSVVMCTSSPVLYQIDR